MGSGVTRLSQFVVQIDSRIGRQYMRKDDERARFSVWLRNNVGGTGLEAGLLEYRRKCSSKLLDSPIGRLKIGPECEIAPVLCLDISNERVPKYTWRKLDRHTAQRGDSKPEGTPNQSNALTPKHICGIVVNTCNTAIGDE